MATIRQKEEQEKQDTEELSYLLQQRTLLAVIQAQNLCLQTSLRRALEVHIPAALEELSQIEDLLNLADQMHDHDSRHMTLQETSFECARERAVLPLLPSASRDGELQELRSLVAGSPWTKADDHELSRIVLAECMRKAAYERRDEQTRKREPSKALAQVQQMTAEELAVFSLPDSGTSLDWDSIASQMPTPSHTGAACRTRWLMLLRPGLQLQPWESDELARLKSAVNSQDIINWHRVAEAVGGHRLPVQCLRAYRQHLDTPQPARAMRPSERAPEDEELLHQASLWGLNWGLLTEKLRRSTSSIKKRYQIALDVQLTRGKWNVDELKRLGEAVKEQVLQRGMRNSYHAKQRNDEPSIGEDDVHQRSLGMSLDWVKIASAVETRSATQCREKWVDRQEHSSALQQPNGQAQEGELDDSGDYSTKSVPSAVAKTGKVRAWTEKEDHKLNEAMRISFEQGAGSLVAKGTGGAWTWTQVGKFVGGRNDKQARDRWTALLKRREKRAAASRAASIDLHDIPTTPTGTFAAIPEEGQTRSSRKRQRRT